MFLDSILLNLSSECNDFPGIKAQSISQDKPGSFLETLQKIASQCEKQSQIIFRTGWRCHVTPLLRELHWLRVPERVTFKLCTMVYRCLNDVAPKYLACDFTRVSNISSRHRLRSASSLDLIVPVTNRSTHGDRAFPVAGSRAWNS